MKFTSILITLAIYIFLFTVGYRSYGAWPMSEITNKTTIFHAIFPFSFFIIAGLISGYIKKRKNERKKHYKPSTFLILFLSLSMLSIGNYLASGIYTQISPLGIFFISGSLGLASVSYLENIFLKNNEENKNI